MGRRKGTGEKRRRRRENEQLANRITRSSPPRNHFFFPRDPRVIRIPSREPTWVEGWGGFVIGPVRSNRAFRFDTLDSLDRDPRLFFSLCVGENSFGKVFL